MIVEKINKEIEVENFGFEDTSNRITLDSEDIGEVLDILSAQLYKDSYGSIIREMVSNAVDSHTEAGVEKPVIVECKYIEGDYYLCITDEGMGISPSRWKDSYSRYLRSTKNKDNNQIGGFGLGSKSPFSYTDLYYVTTIYDGIEYGYTMEKDDEGYPKEDCLYTKAVDKHNGTTVRFLIEGSIYGEDYNQFRDAINEQLMYFDSVYVKNFTFNNSFQIYDGRTFKYRLNNTETEMHLLLGRVKYPIDWKRIGRTAINIPVGVKIEIGSVDILKNREDLRYTDKSKTIVKKAIEEALNELRGYVSGSCDTIDELIKRKKVKGTYQESLLIKINDKVTIPVAKGNYGQTKQGNTIVYPFREPELYFTPFKNTPLKFPDNPYFLFKVKSTLSKGRLLSKENKEGKNQEVKEETNIWRLLHPEEDGRRTNMYVPPLYRTANFNSDKYKNYAIQNALIVERAKLKFRTIGAAIGLGEVAIPNSVWFRPKEEELGEGVHGPKQLIKQKQLKIAVGQPMIGEWGNKLSLIKLYIKEVTKEFVKVSESYDKYPITAYQMQEYDNEMRARRTITIRNTEDIYATDITEGVSSPKIPFDFDKLNNRTVTIVYGDNSFKDQLKAIELFCKELINKSVYYKGTPWKDISRLKVLMINKTDIKRMQEFKNAYNVQEFMLGKNTLTKKPKMINDDFKKLATKAIVYPYFKKVNINRIVFEISPLIEKLYSSVNEQSMDGYQYQNFVGAKLGQEVLNLILENEWYDKEAVERAKLLLQISDDLEVLNQFKDKYNGLKEFDFDDKRLLASLIVKAGYIPDPIYTTKITEQEIKWMQEFEERAIYYKSLTKNRNSKISKILNKEEWKSYPKLRKPKRLEKTSMLLLEMKTILS